MTAKLCYWAVLGLLILEMAACQSGPFPTAPPASPAPKPAASLTSATPAFLDPPEVAVQTIPLAGAINHPQSELSGLAWDEDTLLLLPQYPERFTPGSDPDSDGAIFALSKEKILAFLDGKSNTSLEPRLIPIYAPGLKQKVTGYEGYESVLVAGENVYFTLETSQTGGMVGILIAGKFNDDHSEIHIDTGKWDEISA